MKQQYYGVELIRELSMCFGPSGCEDEVRRVIREQIGDAALVTTDRAGNLIALVRAGLPGGRACQADGLCPYGRGGLHGA